MVKRKYRHPWLCARVQGGGDVEFEDGVGQEKLPMSGHAIFRMKSSF